MILLMVGTNAYQTWTGYRSALDAARSTTENLAHSVGQHADDAIKDADILSMSVVERIEGDGFENIDRNRLHLLFQRQVRSLPQLHGIFVYDEKGNWIYGIPTFYTVSVICSRTAAGSARKRPI
ncbi:hypothetical protein ABQF07_22850, partial [Xanthomonas campestris pv. campestris]